MLKIKDSANACFRKEAQVSKIKQVLWYPSIDVLILMFLFAGVGEGYHTLPHDISAATRATRMYSPRL